LKELAEVLGTTPQVVSRYELGEREPDFGMLIKIANYFSVSVDYLIEANTKGNGNEAKNEVERNLLFLYRELDANYQEAILETLKSFYKKVKKGNINENKKI